MLKTVLFITGVNVLALYVVVYYLVLFKPERKCEGLTPRRQQLIFFKQMAVARSIFTLGGPVQLFWAAFDNAVTGVPLKVAFGYKKIVFWAFQKYNHGNSLVLHLGDFDILGK